MNIFETVKAAVTVKQAAEYCGLNVNRNNMVSCPFHDDRHPSMKLNEDYFYCFGCGASGDVIDLVAKLFNLSCLEAAEKLAEDFGIGPDKPPSAGARALPKYDLDESQPEPGCPGALRDYIHLLETWKKDYAPADYGSNFDNRYAEACRELDYMKYLATLTPVRMRKSSSPRSSMSATPFRPSLPIPRIIRRSPTTSLTI